MKLSFLLTGLLLAMTSFSSHSFSDRLCKDNEEVVFSFILTKSKKIASVCKDKQGNYLVYRFGTKEKVELEYPQKLDKSSWTAFKLYGAKRFGGKANAGFGDYRISFANNGVTYEVFQEWSDEDNSSDIGINVTTDKKKVTLKGDIKTKEGSLLRLDDDQDKIKNKAYDEE